MRLTPARRVDHGIPYLYVYVVSLCLSSFYRHLMYEFLPAEQVVVNFDKATEKGDGNCGIGGLPTVKEIGGAGELDRGDSRWISLVRQGAAGAMEARCDWVGTWSQQNDVKSRFAG